MRENPTPATSKQARHLSFASRTTEFVERQARGLTRAAGRCPANAATNPTAGKVTNEPVRLDVRLRPRPRARDGGSAQGNATPARLTRQAFASRRAHHPPIAPAR